MPVSYLEKVVEKYGDRATLRKWNEGEETLHSTQNFVQVSDASYDDGTEFSYTPTPVKEFVNILPEGWEDKTDRVITVSPDLDISTRDGINADVVLMLGKTFRVHYVEDNRFARHSNRMVFLKELPRGLNV